MWRRVRPVRRPQPLYAAHRQRYRLRRAGNGYVTISLQATIWRYPAGGGAANLVPGAQLEGGGDFPFGPNGIHINPQGTHVYFAVSTSAANPFQGTIYRLPLVAQPGASELAVFHVFPGFEVPDQLAFGARGDLYVSLAVANRIAVLAADGAETPATAAIPATRFPLDNPAGIAFDAQKAAAHRQPCAVQRQPG